jgi:formylglycine-generating enzyme required for sulfatase activity
MDSDKQQPEAINPASFTPLGDTQEQQRTGPSLWQWAVSGVLLLFVLAMWFLFTARSVLFTVEPIDSQMDIDGGLHLVLGDRHLLRSGGYTIRVTAQGYYPLEEEVTIGTEDTQSFHYGLQRLPGILSITSQPEGAQVSVDEEVLGVTPLTGLSVAAGDHTLKVLAQRHQPVEQAIQVTGMEQPQNFTLELAPAWANIALESQPAGAQVYLDGEQLATTPATLEILQGEHQLELRLDRFRAWQQQIEVVAGEHQALERVVLEAADAQLLLSSRPAAASVTLDGEYQGQTPLTLAVEPGSSHRLAIFKAGYNSVNKTVSLEAAEQKEMSVSLAAQLGEVKVQVYPPDAEVRINGKLQGTGGRTLSLPTFEQTLEISARGYRSQRQRFTPRKGLSQAINIRLLTESEARLANLKPEFKTQGGQLMKLFTPGNFTMGASRREAGRRANEVLHPVSLTRLFYLGAHEVTNSEFRQFRKEHTSGRVEGNSLNRDKQPVVLITWLDAALYCNWLSKREKLPAFYQVEGGNVVGFNTRSTGYRLPTEAEWAWAARVQGELLLRYPWGETFPPTDVRGNYADSSSAFITGRTISGYKDGHVVSAPVGSFPANQRGLFDMGGNVAEWVHDVYAIPDSSGALQVDPLGKQQANNHVIKGASWLHATVTELRLSFRDYGKAGRDDVGFRLARYAEEAP